MNQPTLIHINPNEYIERLPCYSFAVNLDRCMQSRNTLNDMSNRMPVPNKTKDWNLIVFHMITGINESNISTKHISFELKYRFDSSKCNCNRRLMLNIVKWKMMNVGVIAKIQKNVMHMKRLYLKL